MPIEIRCESCAKRYRVDDRFAGKRVKCRNCESIISVPAATAVDDEQDLSALSAAAMSNESMGASVSSVVGAVAPPDIKTANRDEDDEEQASAPTLPNGFGAALKAARSRIMPRQFRLLAYPGAAAVDKVLPWVVGALCLIPTVLKGVQVAMAGQPGQPTWYLYAILGLIFLLFLGIVIPLTARGVRMAGEMLHFELPESAGWRTLGLFSLPLALAALFYWQLDDMSGLVFGIVLGLLLLGPLILVAMQLHWVEAIVAWMMGALFFSASAAITAGIAFVVGLVIVASTSGQPKPTTKVIAKVPPKTPTVVATTDPSVSPVSPTVAVTDLPPTTQQAVLPMIPATLPPVTPPVTPTVTPPLTPTVATTTPPDDGLTFTPVNPTPTTPGTTPGTGTVAIAPGTTAITAPPTPKIEAAKIDPSPIVTGAKDLQSITDVEEMLVSQSAYTPLAVLKRTNDQEKIQVIDGAHEKVLGEVSFKRDPAASDSYVITPSGDSVLRVVSWPKLSIQVLPVSAGSPRIIDVDDTFGNAVPLGISAGDQLFVQRDKGGMFGLEMWNLRTGQRLKPVGAPTIVPNGVAIGPDGKLMAVAARTEDGAQVQLLNFGGGSRRLMIKSLDTKWPLEPVALTFSPDSSRVAICFEHDGGVLAMAWNTVTGKQLCEHVFLPGMMPTPPRGEFKGRALDFLGDSNTWLLYGQTVVDVMSGQALGLLGVDQVVGQHINDAKSVDLVVKLSNFQKRIVHVELNTDALAKLRTPTTQPK